jgi:hypothetical protein
VPEGLGERLAERAFGASAYDYSALAGRPGLLLDRPPRRGIRVLAARTRDLPSGAIEALLAWRLGQYLLTGFYDAVAVERGGLLREDPEGVHDGDLHLFAVEDDGDLHAYVTLKQPAGVEGDMTRAFRAEERPAFPCEVVHGRTWQRALVGVGDVPVRTVWEAGRFVRDQRSSDSLLGHRAALELGLAAARLALRPDLRDRVRLITGDLDPEVALKSLRFFFVPVATFPPHAVELPEGDPLAPRYRDHPTAPFVVTPDDVANPTFIRWADLDLALACDDQRALVRLLALRHFVMVKESSLKRPLAPAEDAPYPVDALTSPSSDLAAEALWRAATRGEIPWSAASFGPGEDVGTDRAIWIVDGYLQALLVDEGGPSHLAGLGPEVVFFPYDQPIEEAIQQMVLLRAATPVRALVTERGAFEDFWRRRQRLFETETESLSVEPPAR